MTAGERYGELGGQLASDSDKERGKAHVQRMRETLKRSGRCEDCGELLANHGDDCEESNE